MKANGRTIENTGAVRVTTQMEISTLGYGRTMRSMGRGIMFSQMVLHMKGGKYVNMTLKDGFLGSERTCKLKQETAVDNWRRIVLLWVKYINLCVLRK